MQHFKKLFQNHRFLVIFFLGMQIITILCLIREALSHDWKGVGLCCLTVFLFCLPYLVSKIFRIKIPSGLVVAVWIFIFAAEILGEMNNFYQICPSWDTFLHTASGFLCGSAGFSLIYLLNKNLNVKKLSTTFLIAVPICFSMAVGVVWEMLEYSLDTILQTDTQKDTFINEIHTVNFNENRQNNVVKITNINQTRLYDHDGHELTRFNGYLDIGLHDTMGDLFVGLIGTIAFSVLQYLYLCDPKRYPFAGKMLLRPHMV